MKPKANDSRFAGACAWVGTIDEFLRFNRGSFMETMKAGQALVTEYKADEHQYRAWRDEFRHLRVQLARLESEYRRLHIAFEYAVPGWPDKESGDVAYEKRPDAVIFSDQQVLVLEFKQREPPPYDGFAKETRGYLRLLENWHPKVPRMSAKGALVLTKAVDFGKKYPRVRAISPDRIPAVVRKAFADTTIPCPDPKLWLAAVKEVWRDGAN